MYYVIREGGLSLFGSHGKGTGARVSHCDAGVPVKGHGLLGQNFVGLDVTGAKSLGQNVVGQNVVGQDVTGA